MSGRQDWDIVAMWNGGAAFVYRPPSVERSVWPDVEALFRRWCFCKGIGDVSAKNMEILSGGNGVENAGACMVGTVGVCIVKDSDLSNAC